MIVFVCACVSLFVFMRPFWSVYFATAPYDKYPFHSDKYMYMYMCAVSVHIPWNFIYKHPMLSMFYLESNDGYLNTCSIKYERSQICRTKCGMVCISDFDKNKGYPQSHRADTHFVIQPHHIQHFARETIVLLSLVNFFLLSLSISIHLCCVKHATMPGQGWKLIEPYLIIHFNSLFLMI